MSHARRLPPKLVRAREKIKSVRPLPPINVRHVGIPSPVPPIIPINKLPAMPMSVVNGTNVPRRVLTRQEDNDDENENAPFCEPWSSHRASSRSTVRKKMDGSLNLT